MAALLEYYESGNAPHEALGRAARRLSQGGAIYLGGGVGAEKQQGTPKGDTFHVTKGDGSKSEAFMGPLSAVIRAFTLAGSSTAPDSPGGGTTVADPAAAARLRELRDEEAETQADIRRYESRLQRRQRAQQAGKIAQTPWSPVAVDDDAWEARRIEELRADLTRITAERTKLLAAGKVEEAAAETGKPGTNWKQVSPEAKKKVAPLVKHWMGKAHPWQACVDELAPEKGLEAAKKICSVVKDLGMKTTKWRKGGSGKVSEEVGRWLDDACARLAVVEEQFGLGGLVQLAEGIADAPPFVVALGEGVTSDLCLLALAGHPLAEAVFGIESKVAV